jgi:hypothetical protein
VTRVAQAKKRKEKDGEAKDRKERE